MSRLPVWRWWWSGFLASASTSLSFTPLLLPSSGGTELVDVQRWEYVTTISKHAQGKVDLGQGTLEPLAPEILKRPAGSSVLMSIVPSRKRLRTVWRFMGLEREMTILEHVYYSNIMSFNSYFRHRAEYDLNSGSLLIDKLEMTDTGTFEVTLSEVLANKTITSRNLIFHLEVQEQLLAPHISQNPTYISDRVQLSCVVKNSKVTSIKWLKNDVQLKNQSHYVMESGGALLFIKSLKVSDCGLYTCRVTNDISTNQNSHFVSINGILLIVFYAFVMSVVALISNFTSFIAAIIIIFVVLRNTQVEKYRREFATIFVTFQLLSFICLLMASLLCVYDSGFAPWFRITAGFGCIFSLTMIIFIAVLFLNPDSVDSSTLVCNKYHCCIISLLGSVSVLVPSIQLYQAVHMAIQCKYSNAHLLIRGILAGLIYIFLVLMFALFYTMHNSQKRPKLLITFHFP
ncbi:uncharacterized protein [Narcine bancroftii]|uniref:uncharacterized protein isoform X2 n=1 Tax=Narcine bancroftii TaxID=1343680 RepID=UPI003831494B